MDEVRKDPPPWWRRWFARTTDTAGMPSSALAAVASAPRGRGPAGRPDNKPADFLDTDSSWTYRLEDAPERPRQRAPALD